MGEEGDSRTLRYAGLHGESNIELDRMIQNAQG